MSDKEFTRLSESEEKYRKMIEMAHDAIFSIDPETGAVLEANLKAEHLTGRGRDELTGMCVWDLHPPEERETARMLFKQTCSTGKGGHRNLHFERPDGSLLPVGISATVITYGNRRVIQRICRDMTAHKELMDKNAADRAYFEHVLNMMPVGVGVKRHVESEPEVEFENQFLKEMFQAFDTTECCIRWDQLPRSDVAPAKVTLSDTGVYAEERSLPNNRVYWFTSSYYRGRNDCWRELQIIQDVTQRRQLEEQLQRANEDLERRVEDRTRELREKQAQLVQSEKMASLGSLVAGVAHEINTPLGALKSNIDLFIRAIDKFKERLGEQSDCLNDETQTELNQMFASIDQLNEVNRTASDRIVAIVDSLRRFARLDQAELDTVDIHEGLESTLTLVHHQLKGRVEVIREYGDLPKIECYPNQLNQVFMNLLVNASQAIKDTGRITIRSFAENDTVVMEIADSGVGIPEDSIDRVFDPGFTTKGMGVGTGLGLSIVHQIIENHGGSIAVDSTIGEGTTFRLTLPRKQT